MSDRHKGFVVTLDGDYRTEDSDEIRRAILMIRGVLAVRPVITEGCDQINRERVRMELINGMLQLLRSP